MSNDVALGWPSSFIRGVFQAATGFGLGVLTLGLFFLASLFSTENPSVPSSITDHWLFFGFIGAFVGWFVKFDQLKLALTNDGGLSSHFLGLDLSLPQAYWLTGIVANLAIAIVLIAIWGTPVPPGPLLLWGWYIALHLIVTWQAANKYTGLPLWRGLAKAYVILNWALMIANAAMIFTELATRLRNLDKEADLLGQIFL